MRALKFKRVEIRKPRWDSGPDKTETENWAWRKGLFVVFQDYDGREYDWMPKWDEVLTISRSKESADLVNSDLAKESVKRKGNLEDFQDEPNL